MSVLSVSLSGMAAATARLNVSAQNVANSLTSGALPDAPAFKAGAPTPYQPQQLVQFSLGAQQGGGVTTRIQAQPDGVQTGYDPGASYANAQGMVAMPNVDLGVETVNQIQALQQFKANLKVFEAGDDMLKTALNLRA